MFNLGVIVKVGEESESTDAKVSRSHWTVSRRPSRESKKTTSQSKRSVSE